MPRFVSFNSPAKMLGIRAGELGTHFEFGPGPSPSRSRTSSGFELTGAQPSPSTSMASTHFELAGARSPPSRSPASSSKLTFSHRVVPPVQGGVNIRSQSPTVGSAPPTRVAGSDNLMEMLRVEAARQAGVDVSQVSIRVDRSSTHDFRSEGSDIREATSSQTAGPLPPPSKVERTFHEVLPTSPSTTAQSSSSVDGLTGMLVGFHSMPAGPQDTGHCDTPLTLVPPSPPPQDVLPEPASDHPKPAVPFTVADGARQKLEAIAEKRRQEEQEEREADARRHMEAEMARRLEEEELERKAQEKEAEYWRQKLAAEEQRLAQEREVRRLTQEEEERLKQEEAEARRKKFEEEERLRQATARAEEQQRKMVEAAQQELQRREMEELARKRREAEAIEKRRREELERRQKAIEEDERRQTEDRRRAELDAEEAARRAQAEAAERAQREAEELRQRQQWEQERQKIEEAEAERHKDRLRRRLEGEVVTPSSAGMPSPASAMPSPGAKRQSQSPSPKRAAGGSPQAAAAPLPKFRLEDVLGNLEDAERQVYTRAFKNLSKGTDVLRLDNMPMRKFIVQRTALTEDDLDEKLLQKAQDLQLSCKGFVEILQEESLSKSLAVDHFLTRVSADGETAKLEECRRAARQLAEMKLKVKLPKETWLHILDMAKPRFIQSLKEEMWVTMCQKVFRVVRLMQLLKL